MSDDAKVFDLFWRNPYMYWRELQEMGEVDIAWDRGLIAKQKIDPQKFSSMKFGKINPNWRVYVIGQQDAQEYDATCKQDQPIGSYPTFDWATDNLDVLERYLSDPWGENKSIYGDLEIPRHERPVKGQQHKVFVTNIPSTSTVSGKWAMGFLEKVNKNWAPYCEIFVHRQYSFAQLFGREFCAGSFDPREEASHGKIILVNGKMVDPRNMDPEELRGHISIFGYKPEDMEVARNRCMFNIRSARYASLNFEKPGRPHKQIPHTYRPDFSVPDADAGLPLVKKNRQVVGNLAME